MAPTAPKPSILVNGGGLSGPCDCNKGDILTANPLYWGDPSTHVLNYQWNLDGAAIPSAVNKDLAVDPKFFGHSVTVSVTGIYLGDPSPSTTVSDPLTFTAKPISLAGIPSLVGTATVGSHPRIDPGEWDPSATLAYQWLRDGNPIGSATASSYTPTVDDYSHSISASVTGSEDGFISVTNTSASEQVGAGYIASTPKPTVTGTTKTGNALTAVPGTWDTGVSLGYQWLRDGNPMAGAISSTYQVTPADTNHQISVSVTGSAPGYNSVTQTSDPVTIGLGTLAKAPNPTITGTASIGSKLSANPGTWDDGVSYSYQWLRDGNPINGATGSTYTLGLADLGRNISVSVTGSKDGYTSVTTTSDATTVSKLITNSPCAAAGVDTTNWVTTTGAKPAITGNAAFGSALTGTTGSWPTGVKLCSFWLAGSQAIAGASKASYTTTTGDIGSTIQYVTVGTDKSGAISMRYSDPITVTNATFVNATAPGVAVKPVVGTTLTPLVKSWSAGTTYTYQWLSNGNPISGATGSSYTPTAADYGTNIGVKVCGSKQYYDTLCLTSTYATSVALGKIALVGKPTATGDIKAGATLVGSAGTWQTGVAVAYQWLRDGKVIAGSTGTSYLVTTADKGHTIAFQVTGTLAGYADVVAVSPAKKIATK